MYSLNQGGKLMTVSTALPLMKMDLQYFSEEVAEETEVTEQAEAVEEVVEDPVATETETVEEAETGEAAIISQLAAELATMKAELTELKTVKEEAVEETVQPEETVIEEDKVTPEIAAYEAVLETVITEKSAAIPENIIALMPDNLTAIEKLAWIDKALQAVPKEVEKEKPVIIESIGRPTPVPSTTDIPVEKMSAAQKITHYFETKLKGD